MSRISGLICAFLAVFVLAGCSGGGGSAISPVTPPIQNTQYTSASDYGFSKVLWGLWDISIDSEKWEVEVLPMRSPEWTVNVVKFLQPPTGIPNGVQVAIKDVSEFFTEGRIVVDVAFGHPFAGLDQFTGFDVFGVFISNGGKTFQHGTDSVNITDGISSGILENPDGYTMWMSPMHFPSDGTIFTFTPGNLGTPGFPGIDAADVNGYRYYADGLASEEDVGGFFHTKNNVDSRGKFSPGSLNTREYIIKFPTPAGSPQIKFQYAVTANWTIPDKTLTGDPDTLDVPGDFPLSANAFEPFFASIEDNSTTWYVDDANYGGDIDLNLEVYNWGGVSTVGTIFVSSENSLIPGGMINIDPQALIWESGTFNSSIASIEITGAMPTSSVNQEILIAIETNPQTTYDQGFPSPSPDRPLAGYFRHQVNVAGTPPGELEAKCAATIEPYFDGFGPVGTAEDPIPTQWYLTLDASESIGSIGQYLWELNGDGMFDDAEGKIVSAGFPDPGTHVIELKVVSGVGAEDTYTLPGSYEVVKGTYVWQAWPGDFSDGSRGAPWITIPEGMADSGVNGYILVRGDDDQGGQCLYADNITLEAANEGTRIQGYYGDYDTDEPPMQTGFVRVNTHNVTFDGFEVTGPSFSTYEPFSHHSKLGSYEADNVLFRHLYIHDLNGDCKAILCYFGGSLLIQNVLEVELNGMYQKNQAHEDTGGDGPQIDFLNCTMDRLGSTGGADVGLYVSSGGGEDFAPTVINTIMTDIADSSIYFRRQGPFEAFTDYSCYMDTPTPPDGAIYLQGVDIINMAINEDPLYIDPMSDHHLQEGSPCIDSGDPGILDYDETVSDMGCYGGPYGDWDFEN
jgi:hypothetical protein